jgi:YesN/AraC family two-component response regulator
MTTLPSQPIRVMLVDDHAMVRRGLATLKPTMTPGASEAEAASTVRRPARRILMDMVCR